MQTLNVQQKETPRVGFWEKFGFGGFATAANVVGNFKSMFYLFFLTNVLGIQIAHAGLITTLGIIWDAVNDPLAGYLAVNHTFKNGEKVRPFALWCAIPWAVTTVLMFTTFDVAYGMKLALAMIIYFVFELLNTLAVIPYNSMGGLATNRDSDRRSINVYRSLGGSVGSALGGIVMYPLLDFFGGLDESGNVIAGAAGSQAFFKSACVMGCVVIFGCFIHYFTTKERVKQESSDESKIPLLQVFKMLLGNKSWVMNALYILCYGLLSVLLLSNLNYYGTYVIGSASAMSAVMLALLVVGTLINFAYSPLDKLVGRKNMMVLTSIIFIVGKVWFIFDPYSMGALYVNVISLAIASTFAFILFNTNRNNIGDLVELQYGRRIDSMISTCDGFVSKLSQAMTTLLMTNCLAWAGFDSTLATQSESVVNMLNALMGWIPMLVSVIMLIISFKHPITKEMEALRAKK